MTALGVVLLTVGTGLCLGGNAVGIVLILIGLTAFIGRS
jgi:hypothetical protein